MAAASSGPREWDTRTRSARDLDTRSRTDSDSAVRQFDGPISRSAQSRVPDRLAFVCFAIAACALTPAAAQETGPPRESPQRETKAPAPEKLPSFAELE